MTRRLQVDVLSSHSRFTAGNETIEATLPTCDATLTSGLADCSSAEKTGTLDADVLIINAIDSNFLPSRPNQPRLSEFPAVVISKRKRSFQASWFDKWPWLHWDAAKENVKCHVCQSAKRLGLITFSKNTDSAFVDSGFKNWKKGSERFNDHEKSHMHVEATAKLNAYMKNEDVSARMRKEHSHNQQRLRQALVKLFSLLNFLRVRVWQFKVTPVTLEICSS